MTQLMIVDLILLRERTGIDCSYYGMHLKPWSYLVLVDGDAKLSQSIYNLGC